MQISHPRPSWILALATLVGLLHGASALAQFPGHVPQHTEGGNTTYWLAPSSAVGNAITAWKRGALEKAARLSERALRKPLSPQDRAAALYIACAANTQLGDGQAGLRFCEKAVKLTRARDWRHLSNRANARLVAGQTPEALQDYERALALLAEDASRATRWSKPSADSLQRVASTLQGNLALAQRIHEETGNIAEATSADSADETRLAVGHDGPPQP